MLEAAESMMELGLDDKRRGDSVPPADGLDVDLAAEENPFQVEATSGCWLEADGILFHSITQEILTAEESNRGGRAGLNYLFLWFSVF